MKLWVWSDLHLEMQDVEFPTSAPESADIIVCAGDLCQADGLELQAKEIVERYRLPLIFVPGNHEFYSEPSIIGRSLPSDRAVMHQVAEASKGWSKPLYVLDDTSIDLDGVRFVGGTLWTDFKLGIHDEADFHWRLNDARAMSSDFSRIRMNDAQMLAPSDMLSMHRETRTFIHAALARPFEGKTVVASHHLPHPAATPSVYVNSSANFLFASSERAFGDVMKSADAPALWVCGHTHHPVDVTVGRTRVVCNPHGFEVAPDEQANAFRWDLVIDTEDL